MALGTLAAIGLAGEVFVRRRVTVDGKKLTHHRKVADLRGLLAGLRHPTPEELEILGARS